MAKKFIVGIASLILVFALAACGKSTDSTDHKNMDMGSKSDSSMNMDHMEHSSSGEVPKGLKVAENPTYKVGDKVTLNTGTNRIW